MTYSIVARDPTSGELGVAVQSHYFSVGPVVPWAQPGVGAIATQAQANIQFGPDGLALLASGKSAEAVLDQLLAADEGRESRQLAIVDAHGGVAAHTGSRCLTHAGHVTGENVSCQGNIMATPEIWGAMLTAYGVASESGASMARRLLGAMEAAEALGGDVRGRQSAAILVVPGEGEAWQKLVELRVEDHSDPLVEMARLLGIQEAYALASTAEQQLSDGHTEAGSAMFAEALELLPDSHELQFWAGSSLIESGDADAGLPLVREAIATQPGWSWLLGQLSEEQLPGVGDLRARLGISGPGPAR